MIRMPATVFRFLMAALIFSAALLSLSAALPSFGQETKRNGRPPDPSATPQVPDDKQPINPAKYAYEFSQPQFLVNHIVIEHDAAGRGKISFTRKGEETPIIEPVEMSTIALGRVLGLWRELRFLDSTENYQTPRSFAHLGVYQLRMDDGQRKRTAEFNWSHNKDAWALATEYRRVSDQAILIFDLKLAREIQPLNTPQLMTQMESLLTRDGLSDPRQLVPLLNELKTDEHIPLIARNHAARILKKIEK